jgi:hypothetical protein
MRLRVHSARGSYVHGAVTLQTYRFSGALLLRWHSATLRRLLPQVRATPRCVNQCYNRSVLSRSQTCCEYAPYTLRRLREDTARAMMVCHRAY